MVARGTPDNFVLAEARHFDNLTESTRILNRAVIDLADVERKQLAATNVLATVVRELTATVRDAAVASREAADASRAVIAALLSGKPANGASHSFTSEGSAPKTVPTRRKSPR